ncbi:MAG: methylated-DNA--[protein]-cysteine S-methyltransferase [Propionicimonas sp.]|uniref:methylated-DNA--[protein]-cysteine S-methyltransferase n=1 Tax=Propionicimonas sp. TaxID=1955623 RepID=UPI001D61398D|nr:methylated-DNA--[protein]-cysteine S-methyltransferase [Propionicimonas sp.]MBU4187458.1 methylated-DNA--[protein]-cysteine S-methyltransferase [Actinomycetota bacterium]MBU4207036.1 methylated-DNA--[protein]-cysteine S-methyltransferase [Actinomycetota bacterium]MBU4364877.1 methylated-DNA--[protein]-cysteine S-methyltransferase [Actinomycetota bacterium]MBU4411205.1 methylated-DNA--[protein]-cysteine S-methyltransferase [Actinomycetota bacterium]MBU4417139.1 methylated-DNA--[protein]-cyst
MKLTTFATPDGPLTVLAEDGVVLASGWTSAAEEVMDRVRADDRPAEVTTVAPSDPDFAGIAEALQRYYGGEPGAIAAVPVRQFGTDLQLAGWAALRDIPAGAPLTYAEFAAALGRPTAVRAAARICARNAAALFVPCHRVVRSDGSLGGFAWGLDVKRSLLAHEARQMDPSTGSGN